jgi:ribosome maturation factor RimP
VKPAHGGAPFPLARAIFSCVHGKALLSLLFQLGVVHQSGLAPLFFLERKGLQEHGAKETIRDVAQRVTSGRGYELIDVEVKRERGGHFVRLFVDKEGGIGLDELQSVSEEVSAILDAEDPIDSAYTLEVSSPGLDRPLKTEADYRRFVGKLVKLSSYEPLDGRRHWTGRLQSVEGGAVTVTLEKEKGATARIPLDKIAHGRLEVEFK